MLFICQINPYLRVYNPETEGFAEFKGGRLQLEKGDADFEVVMAEALRNPSIVILTEAVQCLDCGEAFAGKAAPAQLGQHRKAAHFDKWVAEKEAEQGAVIQAEIKRRAPHACDICRPVQEFGDEQALALHIRTIHLTVDVDDEGNVLGSGESDNAAAGAPAEPPAAKAK